MEGAYLAHYGRFGERYWKWFTPRAVHERCLANILSRSSKEQKCLRITQMTRMKSFPIRVI